MTMRAVKTMDGWRRQVEAAIARLRACGATGDTTLEQMADIDYQAFCLVIEGFYALGVDVAPGLMARAQMGSVDDLP